MTLYDTIYDNRLADDSKRACTVKSYSLVTILSSDMENKS